MIGTPSRGWPVLGHLPAFYRNTSGLLRQLHQQQGDVATFRLGRRNAVLLAHPRHVRAVLIEHAGEFTKGTLLLRARRLLGEGLLTSEGEFHHAQRRAIQPVFTRTKVQEYAESVPVLCDRITSTWHSGGRIPLDRVMNTLTMTVVARTLLGADIADEAPGLGAALHRMARWAPLLSLPGGQLFERSRWPLIGRLREAIELVESVVEARIADGGEGAPLLHALLTARPRGEPMPARLVRDEVMTIFLAGHDTTAAALIWTWVLLGAHPEIEAEVHRELGAGGGAESPLVAMVIREVLRLVPPVGRVGRRPIGDVHLDGVVLRAGDAVFLSPYVTQRDPRWFAAPDSFQPMRWAEPAPERPPFAYFPFGAGPRSCIGEHLTYAVMAQVVASVAANWRLRPTGSGLPPLRSLLTLKPRGTTWMVPERR